MPIDMSRLEQLKASGDLPSPKGVALAVMRLTQQEDVSMAELARIIRTDPAFVGRLIKAANGIIGYGRRPVASVQDALTVLGLPAVRTMALGFSLLTNYRSGACEAFDYSRYWSASLVSAVTTQAITQRTRAAAVDEVYCLGLLARIGELAMATLYPKDYARILTETAGQRPTLLLEEETRAFAMNHAELGAAMLADWGLPRVFTEGSYYSQSFTEAAFPEGSREYTIAQTLGIARQMGDLCLAQEEVRPAMMNRLLALCSRLSFDEETTTTLCDGVVREWVEWGVLLDVHAEALPPFEHLSREARERMGAGTGGDSVPVVRAVERDAPPAEEEPVAQIRVLVAEIDDEVRHEIKKVLLDAGYAVAEARDGGTATELALDFRPDMLIVGWRLPDQTGEELVTTLRRTRIGRGIYVLGLNDQVDDDKLIAAFEAGVDDMLSKPLNPRLLLARASVAARMISLQAEIETDKEEIRHFAAELAVSNRRLQEAALMDSLTGFPNRRFFGDRLLQEWAASSRSKRPLSCLMIDIDRFKSINDTYGHDVGDTVLRSVAQAIRRGLRANDVVARTGGDEFLVMCPDTTLEAAMACAERVRVEVEASGAGTERVHVPVSISLGAATRDATISDPDALLKRADQSLYLAKQAGRNMVEAEQLRPHGVRER